MKTPATTLLGTGVILTGALFLTGCDDTQLPDAPGIQQQEDAEDQHQGDNRDDGQEDQGDGPDEEEDEGQGED